jgi:hypothetical protein
MIASASNYEDIGARVTLDGKYVEACLIADDKSGLVVCYAKDDNGNLIVEDEKFKAIVLFGKVDIIK